MRFRGCKTQPRRRESRIFVHPERSFDEIVSRGTLAANDIKTASSHGRRSFAGSRVPRPGRPLRRNHRAITAPFLEGRAAVRVFAETEAPGMPRGMATGMRLMFNPSAPAHQRCRTAYRIVTRSDAGLFQIVRRSRDGIFARLRYRVVPMDLNATCFCRAVFRQTVFGMRCCIASCCNRATRPRRLSFPMLNSASMQAPCSRGAHGGVSALKLVDSSAWLIGCAPHLRQTGRPFRIASRETSRRVRKCAVPIKTPSHVRPVSHGEAQRAKSTVTIGAAMVFEPLGSKPNTRTRSHAIARARRMQLRLCAALCGFTNAPHRLAVFGPNRTCER